MPHEPPLKWKAARSVETPDNEARWIRIDLRGPRPVGRRLALRFRYLLGSAQSIDLELASRGDTSRQAKLTLDQVRQNEWTEATVDWTPQLKQLRATIDELIFRIPHNARLQVDDVLLYEPVE